MIRKAWEDSRKPQGAYKAATTGAQIRDRFFTVVEEVEAKLGGLAIGIASAEGVLMVHPKLNEELRKQPDADVLEVALTYCFVTTDSRRRLNESWPSQVARYRGKANSDETLREKSGLLAAYVVNNLDATDPAALAEAHEKMRKIIGALQPELLEESDMAKGETSDEQDCIVRVEEAAVSYRVLDESAFRFIRGQRDIFMDFLQDDLALNLALLGSSPDRIDGTMAERSREYAEYRQWVPAENADPSGLRELHHLGGQLAVRPRKLGYRPVTAACIAWTAVQYQINAEKERTTADRREAERRQIFSKRAYGHFKAASAQKITCECVAKAQGKAGPDRHTKIERHPGNLALPFSNVVHHYPADGRIPKAVQRA
jgi:hypothetical protein